MSDRRFFTEAPSLSWWEWIKRKCTASFLSPQAPRCISSTLAGIPIPRGVSGLVPLKATPASAAEYAVFLRLHFYPPNAPIELCIPTVTLEQLLETQTAIGAEIRDTNNQLIGCVFDVYAGHILGNPTGLVTWFCIHPAWRKRGIGTLLLFALYAFSQPRQIHWWRNDMTLQSPLPPIWTETHLVRSKHCIRSDIWSSNQLHVYKVPMTKWKDEIKPYWIKKNPAGLILENPAETASLSLQEVWEVKFSKTRFAAILIQPTFEFQRTTPPRLQNQKPAKNQYCEVIAYAWKDEPKTVYEQAVLLEKMLDHLPYEYIEIQQSFPHLDHGWSYTGTTTWSCIGLDPGQPVQRPILPLWNA